MIDESTTRSRRKRRHRFAAPHDDETLHSLVGVGASRLVTQRYVAPQSNDAFVEPEGLLASIIATANVTSTLAERVAPSPRVYSDAFYDALLSMREAGVPPRLARATLRAWENELHFQSPAEPELLLNGDRVQFIWSGKTHYVDLDVTEDGSMAWASVRHRGESAVGSGQVRVNSLPPQFFGELTDAERGL